MGQNSCRAWAGRSPITPAPLGAQPSLAPSPVRGGAVDDAGRRAGPPAPRPQLPAAARLHCAPDVLPGPGAVRAPPRAGLQAPGLLGAHHLCPVLPAGPPGRQGLPEARPGACPQCGHPRLQLPGVVLLGRGHRVCRRHRHRHLHHQLPRGLPVHRPRLPCQHHRGRRTEAAGEDLEDLGKPAPPEGGGDVRGDPRGEGGQRVHDGGAHGAGGPGARGGPGRHPQHPAAQPVLRAGLHVRHHRQPQGRDAESGQHHVDGSVRQPGRRHPARGGPAGGGGQLPAPQPHRRPDLRPVDGHPVGGPGLLCPARRPEGEPGGHAAGGGAHVAHGGAPGVGEDHGAHPGGGGSVRLHPAQDAPVGHGGDVGAQPHLPQQRPEALRGQAGGLPGAGQGPPGAGLRQVSEELLRSRPHDRGDTALLPGAQHPPVLGLRPQRDLGPPLHVQPLQLPAVQLRQGGARLPGEAGEPGCGGHRRDLHVGPHRLHGLPEHGGQDARGHRRRGLAAQRRPRAPGRRRLPLHHGASQRADHHGGRGERGPAAHRGGGEDGAAACEQRRAHRGPEEVPVHAAHLEVHTGPGHMRADRHADGAGGGVLPAGGQQGHPGVGHRGPQGRGRVPGHRGRHPAGERERGRPALPHPEVGDSREGLLHLGRRAGPHDEAEAADSPGEVQRHHRLLLPGVKVPCPPALRAGGAAGHCEAQGPGTPFAGLGQVAGRSETLPCA